MHTIIREELGVASGHEKISPTSVKGITSTLLVPTSGQFKGLKAVAALLTVETNDVRFTIDGTTVSNSVGHIIGAGDSYEVVGGIAVNNLSMIDNNGAADVMVTVFH